MATPLDDSLTITHAPYGKLDDGSEVELWTLDNGRLTLKLITYGARVVALEVPDRDGKRADVTLGYSSLEGYLTDKSFFGCTAGRYANRIAQGRFTLDGETFQLPINDPPNTLHGGPVAFNRKNWSAVQVDGGVEFTLVSPDGDQGFPGTLTVHTRYMLEGSTVSIECTATTDKPTVLNLTNHAYFNLAGEAQGSILNHVLTIESDAFVPVDETGIPTGSLSAVNGTPFDFGTGTTIGRRIEDDNEQLKRCLGYDHTFAVRGEPNELRIAAMLRDPESGRTLQVYTTEPGVQFYTGNHLDGIAIGKSGGAYDARSGMCLETQHFPDSPNHPDFPSTVLRPGETFHNRTTWTFTAD